MIFLDVRTGGAPLSAGHRAQLATSLTRRLLGEDHFDEAAKPHALERARSLTTITFAHVDEWIAGGRPVGAADPTRYLVRVSVPQPWIEEFAPHAIPEITRAIADADDEPERFADESHLFVHVVGVPDCGIGVFGQPMSSSALVRYMTGDGRPTPADLAAAPEGHAVDPICGMVVPLDASALTLELDASTYGFCSTACRRVFAEDHATAVVDT